MGYALFAQRKIVLDGQLNSAQLQQTQRSNEQFALATRHTGLQQQLSSLAAAQSAELADLYGQLAESDSDKRDSINSRIKQKEQLFQRETDAINRQVYQVSIKESSLEMEVKRLDTVVTKLQEELEAVEEAEGKAIDRATPKFNGIG